MTYKLSSICDIKVGYPFKSQFFNTSGEGTRLVRGMNISRNGFRWGNQTRWWDLPSDELSDYYLKEGDVLIAMDGNVETNFALVHPEDLPLLLVQRVARLRAKNFSPKLLWFIIKSPSFGAYLHSVKTGSTISHISAKQIGDYSFELPSDPYYQEKVAKILDGIDSRIYNNTAINDNLSKQAFYSARFISPLSNRGSNESLRLESLWFSSSFSPIFSNRGVSTALTSFAFT